MPHLAELNIGHSIIARSTRIGLTAAVREMKELMEVTPSTMRIFGIGIDVVEVAPHRLGDRAAWRTVPRQLFTPAERAYCEAQKKPRPHYAARFAAKEAVSKALGTGIGGQAGWLDLEIIRDPSGAPKLVLQGAAAAFAEQNGITEIQISLTHAREYAAANAIASANIELDTSQIERRK